MTDAKIENAVRSDSPPGIQSAAIAGDDAMVASMLPETVVISVRVTELTILDIFPTASDGETFLQKLETIGQTNAVVRRALAWMKPPSDGLDLGNQRVREMLDQLAAAGAITAAERDVVKRAAEITVYPDTAQVGRALRAIWPEGVRGPI